ncbi:Cardiolipin synthase CMP-forming [Hondaea fermentalgiana]|uniref:Cardiolipin synthase CMP-forming n=1 Tax=Hondaea fermentalgiana TaxID=2315210 RepID=A0A2R5G4S4_9STRA|nr:Cardiolipin synthase CMP-forming [Hondaea fermentalgiana]|eukprot:GBG26027.1 Cardiolipin synthase CMP-forming [Hondaea fermentalgiana]
MLAALAARAARGSAQLSPSLRGYSSSSSSSSSSSCSSSSCCWRFAASKPRLELSASPRLAQTRRQALPLGRGLQQVLRGAQGRGQTARGSQHSSLRPWLTRALSTGREQHEQRGSDADEQNLSKTKKTDGAEKLVFGSKAFWDDALNIPNALTMTRLVATPGICWLIATDQYKYAIAAFWIAGFFDWVDGYLARKWNQMSVFGSFIDPLADKVFVAGTLLTLTAKGIIPLALGGLIIGRDAVLVLGSFYVRYRTKPEGTGFFDMGQGSGVVAVEASQISKWNTLFQFGLIWFSMTHVAFNLPPSELMPAVWFISGASTFASGYDYWRRANWDNIFAEAQAKKGATSQQFKNSNDETKS